MIIHPPTRSSHGKLCWFPRGGIANSFDFGDRGVAEGTFHYIRECVVFDEGATGRDVISKAEEWLEAVVTTCVLVIREWSTAENPMRIF